MAYCGLSKPIIAKLDTSNDTYSEGAEFFELASTNVTPTYNEGNFYSNNKQREGARRITGATVAVEADHMPDEAEQLIFGRTAESDGAIDSNVNDRAPYVGYGYIVEEEVNGVSGYIANWLYKVRFEDGEESHQTASDSISYTGHNLTGTASANNSGKWRAKKRCTSEADAVAYLKTKAGITPKS